MSSLKDLKILVAEDNILNQKIVKIILEKLEATVWTTSNGHEAIELLKIEQFDVVLMDLNMPVMDGFETTNFIRKELRSEIPIIALTADYLISNEIECMEAGMNAIISKPFEPESFSDLILKLVNRDLTN